MSSVLTSLNRASASPYYITSKSQKNHVMSLQKQQKIKIARAESQLKNDMMKLNASKQQLKSSKLVKSPPQKLRNNIKFTVQRFQSPKNTQQQSEKKDNLDLFQNASLKRLNKVMQCKSPTQALQSRQIDFLNIDLRTPQNRTNMQTQNWNQLSAKTMQFPNQNICKNGGDKFQHVHQPKYQHINSPNANKTATSFDQYQGSMVPQKRSIIHLQPKHFRQGTPKLFLRKGPIQGSTVKRGQSQMQIEQKSSNDEQKDEGLNLQIRQLKTPFMKEKSCQPVGQKLPDNIDDFLDADSTDKSHQALSFYQIQDELAKVGQISEQIENPFLASMLQVQSLQSSQKKFNIVLQESTQNAQQEEKNEHHQTMNDQKMDKPQTSGDTEQILRKQRLDKLIQLQRKSHLSQNQKIVQNQMKIRKLRTSMIVQQSPTQQNQKALQSPHLCNFEPGKRLAPSYIMSPQNKKVDVDQNPHSMSLKRKQSKTILEQETEDEQSTRYDTSMANFSRQRLAQSNTPTPQNLNMNRIFVARESVNTTKSNLQCLNGTRNMNQMKINSFQKAMELLHEQETLQQLSPNKIISKVIESEFNEAKQSPNPQSDNLGGQTTRTDERKEYFQLRQNYVDSLTLDGKQESSSSTQTEDQNKQPNNQNQQNLNCDSKLKQNINQFTKNVKARNKSVAISVGQLSTAPLSPNQTNRKLKASDLTFNHKGFLGPPSPEKDNSKQPLYEIEKCSRNEHEQTMSVIGKSMLSNRTPNQSRKHYEVLKLDSFSKNMNQVLSQNQNDITKVDKPMSQDKKLNLDLNNQVQDPQESFNPFTPLDVFTLQSIIKNDANIEQNIAKEQKQKETLQLQQQTGKASDKSQLQLPMKKEKRQANDNKSIYMKDLDFLKIHKPVKIQGLLELISLDLEKVKKF